MRILRVGSIPMMACIVWLAGCGAKGQMQDATEEPVASEVVGDAERTVTGKLLADGAPSKLFTDGAQGGDAGCSADTVVVTDPDGIAVKVGVGDDCSFTLKLKVGKPFTLSCEKGGTHVATLLFEDGTERFMGTALILGRGVLTVALGQIKIKGRFGRSTENPYRQSDLDGDGVADADDSDDDNDDIADAEEGDCDLDGILDDVDDDDSGCAAEEPRVVRVHEVKPRNDPHPELGEDTVDLDRPVRARIACEVDPASLGGQTFQVRSETDTILCAYSLERRGKSGDRISCEHPDQDFLPNTVYTATIDGVTCKDGRSVAMRSWSWKTASEDNAEEEDEDAPSGEQEDDSNPSGGDLNESESPLPVEEAPSEEAA